MEARHHAHHTVDPVLAAADSEGGVNLIRWSPSEVFLSCTHSGNFLNLSKRQATQFQKIACGSTDTLCLSLDWDNRRLAERYDTGCFNMRSFGLLTDVVP